MSKDETTGIGARLREARVKAGLSQQDVAEVSGLSISFIRLVEGGRSDIALSRLLRWTAAFGMSLAELFADNDDSPIMITRPNERLSVPMFESGVEFFLLTPGVNKAIEPGLFVLEPGADMTGLLEHTGEESLFVIRGNVELRVGDQAAELGAGDAAYYRSTSKHALKNLSETESAEVLVTATHPTLDEKAVLQTAISHSE